MQALRAMTLGLALVGAVGTLPGCATAQPVPPPPYYGDGGAFPDQWEGELASYGAWRTVPQYGYVWWPRVGPGWRPYLYGHWAAGPSGWVWFSDEPWGFTFHYGRWAYAPIGWVWVPGTVWGPAWVDWYWGTGYVGWAPIGFYGAFPWSYWVFVNDYDFGCRSVSWVAHGHHHHHHDGGHHGPPPRRHLERISHHPIVRVSDTQLPHRDFTSRPVRRPDSGTRPGFDERNVTGRPLRGSGPTTTRPAPGSGGTLPGGNGRRPPGAGGGYTETPSRPSTGGGFQSQPLGSQPVRPRPDPGPTGTPGWQDRRFESTPVQPRVIPPQGQPTAPSPSRQVPSVVPPPQGGGMRPQTQAPAPAPRSYPSGPGGSYQPSAPPQGGGRPSFGGSSMQGGGFSSQGVTGGGRGSAPSPGSRSPGMR